MKAVMIIGFVLFGIVGSAYGDVTDNFESYPLNTWPWPDWIPVANAVSNPSANTIALDPVDSSNRVLKMYGVVGSFWAAVTYNSYSFPTDYIVEAKVYNGSEFITGGGHILRATFGMKHGTQWWNLGRPLILFHGNGTILAGDWTTVLGTYETERWYDVKIHYQRTGDNLSLQYWLDGAYLGEIALTIADLSVEESLDHLDLAAQAGTAYFDDIYVYGEPECPPPPPHEPWSFVQITDVHVPLELEKFNDLLREIREREDIDPDFILVTGDIVHCSWFTRWLIPFAVGRGYYATYLEALETYSEVDVYAVPGNHDRYNIRDPFTSFRPIWEVLRGVWNWTFQDYRSYVSSGGLGLYEESVGQSGDYSFPHKGFVFIGLDSGQDLEEGNNFGQWLRGTGLSSDQIQYLEGFDTCTPKIVFMHHPAIRDIPNSMVMVIAKNQGRFIDYCETNNVQLVLTGHTHIDHVLNADATGLGSADCYGGQYPLFIQTPSATEDNQDGPGYRVICVADCLACPQEVTKTGEYDKIVCCLCSPGNLHVYNLAGAHTGIGSGGVPELAIFDSFYFSQQTATGADCSVLEAFPETIMLYNTSEDYRYEVIGAVGGTYGLNIKSVTDGEATAFKAIDIPTSPGARHVYAVNWAALSDGEDDAVVLGIDADGDGVLERTVIADEDLTSDEFTLQTESVIDFEPDVLNLRSPGKVVTAYIELPEGFDVSDITISTLKFKDSVPALLKPVTIGDYDEDGIADLMVKFDRQQVAAVLEAGEQIVYLSGRLDDGTLFAGMDTIRVLGSKGSEIAESEFDSTMHEEVIASLEENLQITEVDSVDTGGEVAFDVEEAVTFMLFEADEIIGELGPESFNNEESAFELACSIDDVFNMLDEGMYFEVMVILDSDILERMDGCFNTGEPDEDDWITSIEGQALLYPLLTETIELLESML